MEESINKSVQNSNKKQYKTNPVFKKTQIIKTTGIQNFHYFATQMHLKNQLKRHSRNVRIHKQIGSKYQQKTIQNESCFPKNANHKNYLKSKFPSLCNANAFKKPTP